MNFEDPRNQEELTRIKTRIDELKSFGPSIGHKLEDYTKFEFGSLEFLNYYVNGYKELPKHEDPILALILKDYLGNVDQFIISTDNIINSLCVLERLEALGLSQLDIAKDIVDSATYPQFIEENREVLYSTSFLRCHYIQHLAEIACLVNPTIKPLKSAFEYSHNELKLDLLFFIEKLNFQPSQESDNDISINNISIQSQESAVYQVACLPFQH